MKNAAAVHKEGLDVLLAGERRVIPWDRITSVVAYKRYLFAYDQICLEITTTSNTYALTEDLEGWKQLIDEMPSYLDGMLPFADWFFLVAFPAFEPCTTRIYDRAAMLSERTDSHGAERDCAASAPDE